MTVYVLAMNVPGRYVVGRSDQTAEDITASGYIHLSDVAHVTNIDEKWTFQPVLMLATFSAALEAYAGFGVATKEATAHYDAWISYRKNPPNFEVEDSVQ